MIEAKAEAEALESAGKLMLSILVPFCFPGCSACLHVPHVMHVPLACQVASGTATG